MSLATTLSRILGYGRDMVSAHLFGAGGVSDAFVVAFRLPNLFRDLFAEGALSAAFVPALTRERLRGEAGAWALAAHMFNALAIALGLLVLGGILGARWFLPVVAPGFSADPSTFQLALRLTQILFPFIGFMGFAALFMGMLHSHRQFFLPALAPAMMNVVMISFGFWVCPRLGPLPEQQIIGWALGALAGGAAQWLIQVPSAWRAGFRWRWAWPWQHAGVRRVIKAMGPAVLGQSATQVNLVVNTILASMLAAGSVTYLYYGNRLMQLPLGIFGVAIASAVLPDLAQHHAQAQWGQFRRTVAYGLKLTLFVTLPAMLGLILLSLPIHVLLLHGGRFDLEATRATAWASVAYTAGVVFAAWVKVLVPAFYAIEKPALPVKVAMATMGLNLGLNLLLWRSLGYLGLASVASVGMLVQALLLLGLLKGQVGGFWTTQDWADSRRMGLAALSMVAVLLGAMGVLQALWPGWTVGVDGRAALGLAVFGLIALGMLCYGGVAWALGLGELLPKRFWPRRQAQVAQVAKASDSPYDGA
jgi:putative peptidoglycan lipid II flippase